MQWLRLISASAEAVGKGSPLRPRHVNELSEAVGLGGAEANPLLR